VYVINIQGTSEWESIKGNLYLLPKIMSLLFWFPFPAKVDEKRGIHKTPNIGENFVKILFRSK